MGEANRLREQGIQFKHLKPGEQIQVDLKNATHIGLFPTFEKAEDYEVVIMKRDPMNDLSNKPKGTIYAEIELSPEKYLKTYHVRFTHSQEAFRWPPEPFIKKLKRFFGIKPKGSPFVKLEDLNR